MPETVAIALRCQNFQKRIVVFRKDSYDEHCLRHPELEDPTFFPPKVLQALKTPTFWVKAYKNDSICYYLELFAINGIMKYVKVVVSNKSQTINGERVYRIKTSFKTDHVQEQKYGNKLHYLGGTTL
ncbi:MAG: hypothetical protein JWL89_396 [Candidatus Saccharibacteria bacterium]|nr:hypothetical protein [Candidatus Saccharibacteria bacterium]